MNQMPQKLLGVLQSLRSGGTSTIQGRPGQLASDLIDSRIEIHDSNHFEVKLDYSLESNRQKNRYRVEAYFFTPLSLGITQDTYLKKQFYNDVQAYIRFKTPGISLAALLASDSKSSPLARLDVALPMLVKFPQRPTALENISYDLRLVGCLIRAHVRDRIALTCEMVNGLGAAIPSKSQALEDIRKETGRLLSELGAVLSRFRGLRMHLLDPGVPAWIRETQEYVDEYLSITNENFLTRLLQVLDEKPQCASLFPEMRALLRESILTEQEHRAEAGYPSLVESDGGLQYVFRRGLLKKFVMSVLFLEISKDKEGGRVSDVFAAIAAGISMLVASLVGLWVQQRYLSSTWPFLVTIVLLYMLKDRLKEWLRTFFSRKMTRFLADYSVRIFDSHSGLDIGRCREAFGFLRPEQIPPEVLALRHRNARASIEPTSKPEVVIKYEKEITLNGKVVEKLGGLQHEINDIIRFNLSQFLVQADDPVAPVIIYDPVRDQVEEIACPKVYHINLVFVLRAEDKHKPPSMEHVRVVIDKQGIRSLQHMT
jgi:hypothetical protein